MNITPLKKRFAVIALWPDQMVAEHENIARLGVAASELGVEMLVVDRYGFTTDGNACQIDFEDVDFVLHLHFDTPKSYDAISYGAIWNPLQFYSEWGFSRTTENQLSHDFFLNTSCSCAFDYFTSIHSKEDKQQLLTIDAALNHTLSGPIIPAAKKTRRVAFYCGINWEKLDGRKGRHSEILSALDSEGLIAIYGPSRIRNVDIWAGFSGYVSSLPFDGRSVVEACASAGIALVLSSDAHRECGIMSNRLFEALSAGAVIIGDDHPFLTRFFEGKFLRVDTSRKAEEQAEQILQHIRWANNNPEEAFELALSAQQMFLERYTLTRQLRDLYTLHEQKVVARQERAALLSQRNATACLVMIPEAKLQEQEFATFLAHIARQLLPASALHVFARSETEAHNYVAWLSRHPMAFTFTVHTATSLAIPFTATYGRILNAIVHRITDDFIITTNGFDLPHHDLIYKVVSTFDTFPHSELVTFPILANWQTKSNREEYCLQSKQPQFCTASLIAQRAFRTTSLKNHSALLQYLGVSSFLKATDMLFALNASRVDQPLATFKVTRLKNALRAEQPTAKPSILRSTDAAIETYIQKSGTAQQRTELSLKRTAEGLSQLQHSVRMQTLILDRLTLLKLLCSLNPFVANVVYRFALPNTTRRSLKKFTEAYYKNNRDVARSKIHGTKGKWGPLGALNHALRYGISEKRPGLMNLLAHLEVY